MNRVQQVIIAALFLAAFAFGVSFIGGRDILYAPALTCLVLAALACVLPALHTGGNTISLPGRTPAALLFLFWIYATISLSWSLVPYVSLVTWLVITALPLVFFALACPPNRASLIRACTIALAGATGILALWATGEAVFGHMSRAQGPMSDPNNLAALFNLSLLPALACLFTRQRGDKEILPVSIFALVLFAGLLATQSRGGFIALIISLPVLLIMMKFEKKRLANVALAAVALIALFHFAVSDAFIPRLLGLLQPASDGPASARLALWGSAWQMLTDNPLAGTGLGTFYLFYPAYRIPIADDSVGSWVHMDPLQFGVEMGVLAPLLFYAFVISLFVRTNRALDQGHSPEKNAEMSGVFAGIFAVIVQAHVNFPLYTLPVLIVTGVWLAKWYDDSASLTQKPSYESAEFRKKWHSHFVGGCVAVSSLLFLGMMASTAAGQYYVERAVTDAARNDLSGFITNIESAQRYAPASFADPKVQMAGLYIDMMNMPLLSADERTQMIDDGLTLLSQAEDLNPGWAEINYKRGKLYSLLRPGEKEGGALKADEEWRTALRKNPMHYKARLSLASSLTKKGRAADAFDILSAGLTYPLPAAGVQQIKAALTQVRDVAALQTRLVKEMETNPGKFTDRKKKKGKTK